MFTLCFLNIYLGFATTGIFKCAKYYVKVIFILLEQAYGSNIAKARVKSSRPGQRHLLACITFLRITSNDKLILIERRELKIN